MFAALSCSCCACSDSVRFWLDTHLIPRNLLVHAGLVDFLNDSLEGVNIDPKTDQIFEEIKKGQLLWFVKILYLRLSFADPNFPRCEHANLLYLIAT
jgi:hypothetical protein